MYLVEMNSFSLSFDNAQERMIEDYDERE